MKKFLNTFKKSEVAIYAIAIMLVAAGYLNYSTMSKDNVIETSSTDTTNSVVENTSIGDATLVNSDDVLEEALVDNDELEEASENIEAQEVSEDTDEEDAIETNSEQSDYFTESKLNRDTSYASMISNYTAILEKDNVSETEKQIAMQEITKINSTKNAIMICENLLSTKGFSNSVIFVNDKSVNVVVKVDGGLTQEKVAQIQNIVSRELDAEITDVHISEK